MQYVCNMNVAPPQEKKHKHLVIKIFCGGTGKRSMWRGPMIKNCDHKLREGKPCRVKNVKLLCNKNTTEQPAHRGGPRGRGEGRRCRRQRRRGGGRPPGHRGPPPPAGRPCRGDTWTMWGDCEGRIAATVTRFIGAQPLKRVWSEAKIGVRIA